VNAPQPDPCFDQRKDQNLGVVALADTPSDHPVHPSRHPVVAERQLRNQQIAAARLAGLGALQTRQKKPVPTIADHLRTRGSAGLRQNPATSTPQNVDDQASHLEVDEDALPNRSLVASWASPYCRHL